MRFLIFGIGRFYLSRKELIEKYDKSSDIVGFVDNRANEINEFEGKPIYSPKDIVDKVWDFVVIMSVSCEEMCSQLMSLGIPASKIMFWEGLYAYLLGDQTYKTSPIKKRDFYKLKILLVAADVCFDGSSMVILYTANELSSRGYDVTVLAPSCSESLKEILLKNGVSLKINRALKFLSKERYKDFSNYDVAIVNVYPNVRVACELSNYIPTLWWIHENGKFFNDDYVRNRVIFFEYNNIELLQNLRVAAVSQWAADVFEKYYPNRVDTILSLGIPDESNLNFECSLERKISFAIIGRIEERKAQDIFVEAVSMLPLEVRNKASFLLIGARSGKKSYVDMVEQKASNMPNVIFTGVLDRVSMRDKLDAIDVVVCSSREETLSITIIEGMMNGKICITTDATGIAKYMHDGIDGFVVQSGNALALAEKMRYIIENRFTLTPMRKAARKVYDNSFSMYKFGDRLEFEVSKTIDEFKQLI